MPDKPQHMLSNKMLGNSRWLLYGL